MAVDHRDPRGAAADDPYAVGAAGAVSPHRAAPYQVPGAQSSADGGWADGAARQVAAGGWPVPSGQLPVDVVPWGRPPGDVVPWGQPWPVAAGVPGAAGAGGYGAGYGGYPGYPGYPSKATSGMAVTGFVLGLLGLGAIGIIFSLIAIPQVGAGGRFQGKGLNVAGLIINGMTLAFWLLLIGVGVGVQAVFSLV